MVQIVSQTGAPKLVQYYMAAAWAAAANGATLVLYPDPLGNDTPPTATVFASDEATKSCFDATLNPGGAEPVIRSVYVSRQSGATTAEPYLQIQSHDGTRTYLQIALEGLAFQRIENLNLVIPGGFRVSLTNGTTKNLAYYIEYDVTRT